MARWSEKLGDSVNFALDKVPEETFLDNFFVNRAFQPSNEEEKKEFEDFSFISSAMALSIHIALADEEISNPEKHRILSEMLFQLEQYHYEYKALSQKFGNSDKEIVFTLYDKLKEEMLNNSFDLDQLISLINKFYEKNPYKKLYLLRLCYIVAYTESADVNKELSEVQKIADSLNVDPHEHLRVRQEVRKEITKYRG